MMYDPTTTTQLFLPPDMIIDQPSGLSGMPGTEAARRHRRARRRMKWPSGLDRSLWLRCASLLLAALASALVAMLSVLGGLVSYEPLRDAAAPSASDQLTAWWPLLIYGPWLVASLSILRAALHQRRSLHSWAVVILFSGLAVGLCVSDAPRTATDIAVAGLPPISALVAFHQIVRQMTLIHPPRHALPRQRGTVRRRD
ncbi:DUF2637 domain-containing protein [Streptomyces litchfieldiae]|uniref:DUF2637 domain-containing protein n=1 Tax=Streptomyces litchfieldiae TaxID=3075543 RepID=A0ABU2MNU5_9ACTN|nr:DUF2637 domain-containing protein [Streptomyces sp. DSM 44938]MDT0342593.1 DUF2637 domain-containing protein [Streptomyces sp. DSM 44938]